MIRIIEIFESIDGEINGFNQGRLTTFIRFAGCNMNCHYCDTKESQNINSGFFMSVDGIIEQVKKYGNKNITITGGEPLLQIDKLEKLVYQLSLYSYKISIETNGTIIHKSILSFILDEDYIRWVVDIKLFAPDSFEFDLDYLKENDFLKFVICNEEDYLKAKNFIQSLGKTKFNIAFSPNLELISVYELLFWLQRDNLYEVIINIQLHKLLNIK